MPGLEMKKVVANGRDQVVLAARRTLYRFPVIKDVGRWFLHRTPNVFRQAVLKALLPPTLGDIPYEDYRLLTTLDASGLAALREETRTWSVRPLVSLLVAVYDTDPDYLRACVQSVRDQAYENWELCLVDDRSPNPQTWELVQELTATDPRIRSHRREVNGGISAATNDALAMATGEFCGLLDHDDLLDPEALAEVVRVIHTDPDTDMVFTDEDKVSSDGLTRSAPHFKPGWSPEMLWSANYITHFACIRTTLLRDLGGFDSTCDGSQDWDLFLRVAGATDKIKHVPVVLYAWRLHERSTAASMATKPYAVAAQKRALEKAVAASGVHAVVEQDPMWSAYWRVRRTLVDAPKVSVILPVSEASAPGVKHCVTSVLARTTYDDFELIVVGDPLPHELESWLQDRCQWDPRLRREQTAADGEDPRRVGVERSHGEVLMLLSPDVAVGTGDWMETLVVEALRSEVGAVGPLVLDPSGMLIRHVGVSLGVGDAVAVRILEGEDLAARLSIAQHMQVYVQRDVSAVSDLCLVLRREVWDAMGGLTAQYGPYASVDLCCRIREAGLRVIYTPCAELKQMRNTDAHPSESARAARVKARKQFVARWPHLLERDPYRNPAFAGSGSRVALKPPTRSA